MAGCVGGPSPLPPEKHQCKPGSATPLTLRFHHSTHARNREKLASQHKPGSANGQASFLEALCVCAV